MGRVFGKRDFFYKKRHALKVNSGEGEGLCARMHAAAAQISSRLQRTEKPPRQTVSLYQVRAARKCKHLKSFSHSLLSHWLSEALAHLSITPFPRVKGPKRGVRNSPVQSLWDPSLLLGSRFQACAWGPARTRTFSAPQTVSGLGVNPSGRNQIDCACIASAWSGK